MREDSNMITEKGKNYFVSSWTACDCHLHRVMYNALLLWTIGYPDYSIGIVSRDYNSGFVTLATVYKDDVTDEELIRMENHLETMIERCLGPEGYKGMGERPKTKICRYKDLQSFGYSDKDIEYCFMWNSIFKKQV